ncbi:uncharacterized protein C2845_PM04G06350 [Panicum miliaceum]|uniref:F-box domain-containing protein n=1 Tax=Panicum miliaceum TaxID=4540 RepID=A0A3L6QV88_PANMI|nr:uncharacterized protein C2845_PM04G06350 [Panicum miliaceum]
MAAPARKKPWFAPGDGADHLTALPLELRAQIVASLPFRQIVQLSALSRPWRHIHHHAPVVKLRLYEFVYLEDYVFGTDRSLPGVVDEGAILGLRLALGRRARGGSASRVDTLALDYSVADPRMPRHADRLIALADAREIRVAVPFDGLNPARVPWKLDLPPAARRLDVDGEYHVAPAIAGPGAAALRRLRLDKVSLGEWPRLPSLRSLALFSVTVEAPFTPAAWCPLLEHLGVSFSTVEQARVDIRLPLLKSLDMEDVDVRPHDDSFEPFGQVTIDAPELEELVLTSTSGGTAEYRSFTLRAPRLRYLGYHNQFTGRVDVDVGRPGSVRAGSISFESNEEIACPEMKLCRM